MVSMTCEGSRTPLEIQNLARLIDHHAAHRSEALTLEGSPAFQPLELQLPAYGLPLSLHTAYGVAT
jgi:hypothetical protein